jgi:head-tail adaptor
VSFDSLLNATLVIWYNAVVVDGDGDLVLDDYGQPMVTATTLATVDGRIDPLTAREVARSSQAGAALSTHCGYLYPVTGLTAACWIEVGSERYDIVGVPDAAGAGHHLELALKKVA